MLCESFFFVTEMVKRELSQICHFSLFSAKRQQTVTNVSCKITFKVIGIGTVLTRYSRRLHQKAFIITINTVFEHLSFFKFMIFQSADKTRFNKRERDKNIMRKDGKNEIEINKETRNKE